jgi:hypothetical protein
MRARIVHDDADRFARLQARGRRVSADADLPSAVDGKVTVGDIPRRRFRIRPRRKALAEYDPRNDDEPSHGVGPPVERRKVGLPF